MKKTLAMLLVFVMLFSLCACNNSDNQTTDPSDSSQSTTNGTENSTDNTETPTDGTEGTQAPTDEPTSDPTEEPPTAPTDEPTTPPTQAPTEAPTTSPTTCSHNWKDATCTAPKTCSKCGATEGSAAGHSWKDATCTAPKTCSKCGATEGSAKGHSYNNGACSVCGTADPSFKQLTDGVWRYITEWDIYTITFDEAGNAHITDEYRVTYEDYQSQQAYIQELKNQYGDDWSSYWWNGEIYTTCTIDGVEYYLSGYSRGYDCTYSEKDGTVILGDASTYEFGLLARTAGNQLTATAENYEIGGNEAVYTWSAS